jgi:hypothetical protein
MWKVELHKIKSNHQNLRTDIVEGFCYSLPKVGEGFTMFGKGLEFGMRSVYTTEVQELTVLVDEYIILFRTENSVYTLLVNGEQTEAADITT